MPDGGTSLSCGVRRDVNEHSISLPAGFTCPRCGYDLGGSAVARCSECGREVGAGDVRAFWARVELRPWKAIVKRHGVIAAAVIVVMGAGAWIVAGEWASGLWAAGACAAAIALSWAMGGLTALASPRDERWPAMATWMRTVWWLHGPWLCMPVCALALAGVAGLELHYAGSFRPRGTGLAIFHFFGAVAWLIGSVAMPFMWFNHFQREITRLYIDYQRIKHLTLMSVTVIYGVSMTLGIVGGAFSLLITNRMGIEGY